jgi:hypothetical protein
MADTDKTDPTAGKSGDLRGPSTGSLIFISHDNRDADLAEAFSKLLSSVSAGVLKSFRSSDRKGSQGIEYGVEWYPELMSKLEAASDVVCLLTQRSLDRPWLLYEAGVAKGKLSTPVYGISLGIPLSRANSGPFAQFQNCDDNEESLTKLVMQLVRRIPGSEPDHDAIQMQVKTFKDKTLKTLAKLGDARGGIEKEPVPETSVAKLFEEIKVMFQDLPSRLDSMMMERPARIRRMRRFHPMMMHEMAEMIGGHPGDPVGLLVIASLFKDDFPWLQELIMDAYRTAKSGDSKGAEEAFSRLRRAVDFAMRGPFLEEMGMSRDMHMMFRELPMMLDHMLHRFAPKPETPAMRRKTKKESTE